jgi:trehalose 6-phosphate phosphatase
MPVSAEMSVSAETTIKKIPPSFAAQLSAAAESLLLLDYDGTLAPFQTNRSQAFPYPPVIPLLESILDRGRTKIVIVTGRPIAGIRPLLHPLRPVEIWGSHGMECMLPDGSYLRHPVPPEISARLNEAERRLTAFGLGDRIETKPGGIAVHWRGVSPTDSNWVVQRAQEALHSAATAPGLKLLEFDGGLELRVAHPDKGDAVASVLSGTHPETPAAYLGDDLTDESAFHTLNPRGLTALVRSEHRPTEAQIWLRPPGELLEFLQQWRDCLPQSF